MPKTREDEHASVMQAAVRGRNARKTDKAKEAQQKVATNKKDTAEKKKKDVIAKEAERAAERQRLAENTFADADVSGDGAIDVDELSTLLTTMLKNEKISFTADAVQEFVKTEFDVADLDNDGKVGASHIVDGPRTGVVPHEEGRGNIGRLHSDGVHRLLDIWVFPVVIGPVVQGSDVDLVICLGFEAANCHRIDLTCVHRPDAIRVNYVALQSSRPHPDLKRGGCGR